MGLSKLFGLFLVCLAVFVFSFYTTCLVLYPFLSECMQKYLLTPTQVSYLMFSLLTIAGVTVGGLLAFSVVKSKQKQS